LAYPDPLTDIGVSLSYYKRVLKRRPASLTDEEWLDLLTTPFRDRGYFRDRDGVEEGRVQTPTVLCPWCRCRHSPGEVEACMALPRKTATVESSGSSTLSVLDAGPLTSFCELWAFLTLTSYPDGTKRATGKISLSCESGLLGLSLQDVETGQYGFLQGRSLQGLLEEVELRLDDGSLPWRPSKYGQGKAKK
jgi:hypothetical protein